ncbi:winged helix-turn-helix transcriptional regulator [Nocardia terpenica]|uniref:MarR family winged helix-turn-helix transcriptional regulator n=1 Tax=Nocardia terpenica TaxID=455432 RepID=UPI001893F804|nr:MarR family winged helix-turn-helix transcriptional regulator [Nocardia terpenica]MBF6061488.1 winged helix-turn-helix transcriptional regulator [Nocardia terpenica]MBF6105283.1 winged helix-turn-helix transcriptional regulator [Nocardia terpenica]MBF6113247.1 winged helix-turn-helix transcriptional regulator [Nocardia terpenica]MBF6119377.1 winged helix-turn-helix transcriptional regulator [Nocardia terpenica]MBF6153025.1 winged helix-turn-helix transcriptional regulator [Nocardia terpenic
MNHITTSPSKATVSTTVALTTGFEPEAFTTPESGDTLLDPAAVSHIATRLRDVTGVLARRARKDAGEHALPPAEAAILGRVQRSGPITAVDLAHIEGLRPQTVRNIVSTLRDRGLVTGVRDTRDTRRVNFGLTETGRARARGALLPRDEYLSRALNERLTPSEFDQLTAALPVLEKIAYHY